MVVPVVAKVRNGVPLPLVVASPNSVPVSAGVGDPIRSMVESTDAARSMLVDTRSMAGR